MGDAEQSDRRWFEVRCLGTGMLEVLTIEEASKRAGVALGELVEALTTFGACETDGYRVVEHETLHGPL